MGGANHRWICWNCKLMGITIAAGGPSGGLHKQSGSYTNRIRSGVL